MVITKLTPEQESQLDAYTEKWIEIGLRTGPCDRSMVRQHVDKLYECVGLKPPEKIMWCDSPYAGNVVAVKCVGKVNVRGRVWGRVFDRVWGGVERRVRDRVWGGVRRRVMNRVWDRVGNRVGNRMWNQMKYPPSACLYGSHDAHRIGFCDYYRGVLGIDLPEIEGLNGMCGYGWYWAFKDKIIISELPSHMSFDDENRLHNENGMAIQYPDGWGVYLWHGVTVPERVILSPETITVEDIDNEDNVEVRRVMMERYGEGKYLENSGSYLVDSSSFGMLYKRKFEDDEPLCVVRVVNSSPEPDGSRKVYYLEVPPDMKTARQAVAWTFGLTESEYDPVIET